MEIKEIKDGKIILVEKEKKFTYENVVNKLFYLRIVYWIDNYYKIDFFDYIDNHCLPNANNATSKKQLEKLLAINKLMNVAKYLNGDWQFDWNDICSKYYICLEHTSDELFIDCTGLSKVPMFTLNQKNLLNKQ